jgi:putative ABC transport system substrate-binding protein
VTGVSNIVASLAPKRIALLKETIPTMRRLAVIFNPDDPITVPQLRDVKASAPTMNIEARMFPVREPRALPETFQNMLAWRADCGIWLPGQAQLFRAMTVKLAAEHKLPVMVDSSAAIALGGFISYGPDNAEVFRRTASKVDRILKGAKPGDLPIEQPTKLELIVNLKAAEALGLKIPPSVMLRADRTIQ